MVVNVALEQQSPVQWLDCTGNPTEVSGGMVANVQLASFVKNVTQARAVGHVEDSCFRGPDSCLRCWFEFAPHYEGPLKGQFCNSHRPPRSLFRHNQYCKPFVKFVRWSLDLWRPGVVSLAKVLNPFGACVSARFFQLSCCGCHRTMARY